jgi:hypothetical protein
MSWTMPAFLGDKMLERIDERQAQKVHGQINRNATTELRSRVVPLDPCGRDLETCRAQCSSASGGCGRP